MNLTRRFHTDRFRRLGKQMDTALDSHCDLGSMDTYSPASKCSSALTRLAKLVSPFQDCLKEPTNSRQSPHRSSRSLHYDQYKVSRFTRRFLLFYIASILFFLGCEKKRPKADLVFINAAEPESLDPQIVT